MAIKASSTISPMSSLLQGVLGWVRSVSATRLPGIIAASLCAGAVGAQTPEVDAPFAAARGEATAAFETTKSRWLAVDFDQLPGFGADDWSVFWAAWAKSCARPPANLVALCPELRRLSLADLDLQRAWLIRHFQAYQVAPKTAPMSGQLTAYFEPELLASREPRPGFEVALYGPPAQLARRKPWYTRAEIDTVPAAAAALSGRTVLYLQDPIDALVLQIQGSGRVWVLEPDGTRRRASVVFAGSNDHPYKSVGRWLLERGWVRDASWAGIRAWAAQNPSLVPHMLASNPRVVFFKLEFPSDVAVAMDSGPRGAAGLALTPGRSLAVDRASIPLGTALWMSTPGPLLRTQRMMLAQDAGSAIVGAVRADYFAGSGDAAGDWAARVKQPLALWALWPRGAPAP